MTFYFFIITGGALFGTLLGWILMLWVKVYISQIYAATSDHSLNNNSIFSPEWGIIALLTITAGSLAWWRQWDPKFFSDMILVTSMAGIALIDRKTMLIEGRLVALAILLRLCWLLYFSQQDIIHFISGLLIGAGLLFFVGFLYETFRHRQGLGEGDAAVLGLIGMWVGWQGLGTVLLIAAVTGTIIGGIALLTKREKHQDLTSLLQTRIPFSPYLCIAGVIVYLLQETGYRIFVSGINHF